MITVVLLVATVAGPALAYYGWVGWLTASVTTLLFGPLLTRWVRRQPHPRLDKARAVFAPRASSAKTVIKSGDQSRRQHGLASALELHKHGSARAVKKLAPVTRPTLANITPSQRRALDVRDVALELCRVGRQTVYSSLEMVVLYFGGPRKGKTGWLSCRVIDYPGSVVTTSTRIDIFTGTHRERLRRGPVYVFNAGGFPQVGDYEIGFDPLTGCGDPETAFERAEDMIPDGDGEEERWRALARAALSSLMHAAALGGHTMDVVQRWVADPDQYKDTVIGLLRASPSKTVVEDAGQFLTNNEKTRSSITTSIMPALRWLQSSHARRAAGFDGHTNATLDARTLMRQPGTLYVLGRRAGHTYPLMAALTGYIARAGREHAADQPTGRCDPPLGLLLDEAGDLAPPLPDWTRDMGGSGITIAACFQSYAQLVRTWGEEGAAVILNNAGPVMLGGGTKNPNDLSMWTELAGNRDEVTETTDSTGKVTSRSQRPVPVLPPSRISAQKRMEVILFHGEIRPALGRTTMLWERNTRHAQVEEEVVEPSTPGTSTTPRWRSTTPDTAVVDYLPLPDKEEVETDAQR